MNSAPCFRPPKRLARTATSMTSAVRLFMLDDGDQIFRLPAARYARMLRQPSEYPLGSFANRRVRCAEAVVELKSRKAVRVVRMLFWNANFDDRGVLDTVTLGRQSVAALDAILEEAWPREHPVNIVDATARFVAKGGTWTPTAAERTELSRAALGERDCVVLSR
jgi:hypothetical protein